MKSGNGNEMVLPVSVVIPAYCEEKTLPRLLESIKRQLFVPDEIIVADASSPDNTKKIAEEAGCTVVKGGKIAVGRNNGAAVARNEYLLFLDADTSLTNPTMLVEAFTEFIRTKSDVASAGYKPDKKDSTKFGYAYTSLIFGVWNVMRDIQSVSQYPALEGGAFILVKKKVYEALGGFDQKIAVGEDRDFFVRAVKKGYKYHHLTQDILTSTRRYSTPRKSVNTALAALTSIILLGAGVYVGSRIVKSTFSLYGRLGGGDGKDPNED